MEKGIRKVRAENKHQQNHRSSQNIGSNDQFIYLASVVSTEMLLCVAAYEKWVPVLLKDCKPSLEPTSAVLSRRSDSTQLLTEDCADGRTRWRKQMWINHTLRKSENSFIGYARQWNLLFQNDRESGRARNNEAA